MTAPTHPAPAWAGAGAGLDDPERWQDVRTRAATADAAAEILARADAHEREPVPPASFGAYAEFGRTGDRTAFEAAFRARRNRLADLALAALLDPARDVGPLADVVWAICDEYQWAHPANVDGLLDPQPPLPHDEQVDLCAAETAAALVEITGLLADRLPALVIHRARAEARRRVLEPFLARDHWWERAPTNWAAVCAGSLLLAGLPLLEDGAGGAGGVDGGDRDRLVARALAALDTYLDGFDEDGVCAEGVDYWHYGFGYFAAAAEALRERSGGAVDLWDDAAGRPARVARFPQQVRLTGDVVASFADTRPRARLDRGLLALLAARVPGVEVPAGPDLPEPGDQRYGRWVLASRSLVWGTLRPDDASVPERSASTYLAHAQWLAVRDREDGRDVGLAARGGHNDELHNHNDVGSFVLAADGEILLADPGVGVYDRDYFSDRRYENPATGSHGHSVPLVDGVRQHGWSADAAARVLDVARAPDAPGRARFSIEYAAAYDHPDLRSLTRTWTYADGRLDVDDAFTAARPLPVVLRLVGLLPFRLLGDGRAAVVGDRVRLDVELPAGARAATGVLDVAHGLRAPIHLLDLTLPSAAQAAVRTTFRVARTA
ncbi:heparinase II/III domain-containing protein [Isoptericola variabilis]|uniref:heparinase II/III domain-containing protein n=1 Tax=Isoptericola variabilis TaxID=139208 RepID=UPI003D1B978D